MSESKNHETISDIVAEIREKNPEKCYPAEYGGGVVPDEMRALADRIEAAYRLSQFTPRQLTEIAQQAIEFSLLLRENARMKDRLSMCEKINEQQDIDNARLRAALKPVLECETVVMFKCFDAVRDAQRIYNEGEKAK